LVSKISPATGVTPVAGPIFETKNPGQDPRNTPKVATQASAARLGPAAAACTSLFARSPQEVRGRKKSAQIQDKRARAGADGRELRETPLRLGDPDK